MTSSEARSSVIPLLATALVLAALLLALPFLAASAAADEGDEYGSWSSFYRGWTFSATESFDYRYHSELFNAGEENQFRNFLDTFLTKGKFTIGLSLDVANFFPREPYREFNNFIEVDRFFIDYGGEHLYGTAGDFYTSFGRGLTLSVLKDDLIYRDDTIRGLRSSLRFEHLEVDLLGGYVENRVTDEEDWVSGFRGAVVFPRDIRLGVTAVWADDKSEDWVEGEHKLGSAFLSADGIGDQLDLYAEYALKESELDPTGERGHGFYGAATWYRGQFNVLGEYKDYERFKYEYNNPPTADRLDEFVTPDDTRGFRIKPAYSLAETSTDLYVSYARFESILSGSVMEHYLAGVEQQEAFDRLYFHVVAGRKAEKQGKDENRAELAATLDVLEEDSIIVDGLIKYARDPFYCNTEVESSIGYSFSGRWILTALYQYSQVPVWDETDFWGGELTVNLTESLTAKVFAGALKGGQVCSGGQCRYEDPFEGAKLTVVYRF